MRLSLELTPEQHQSLQASAALEGKTLETYVLEQALKATADGTGLQALETLLRARLEAADRGSLSGMSLDQLVDDIIQEEAGR